MTVTDAGKPVLTYHFGNVPVPAGVTGRYAVARADYIHPLYGPEGEELTRDYSPDHPHHRGIYWAWPEVTWKGETRDLHALQGVFARPVRVLRKESGRARAVLEVESVWRWGDADAVARERARISVMPERGGRRIVDLEFEFEGLVENLTLARRDRSLYGGLNLRLSARENQKIAVHSDGEGTLPRRAWACLAGTPPGGSRAVSLVILQPAGNPDYPGDWVQYPELNWLQPTFPAKNKAYELKPGGPLVLKYRLVIVRGELGEADLAKLWADYDRGMQSLPASGR